MVIQTFGSHREMWLFMWPEAGCYQCTDKPVFPTVKISQSSSNERSTPRTSHWFDSPHYGTCATFICNSEVKRTAGQQHKIKGANVMNTITITHSPGSPITEIQPTWNETRELLNIWQSCPTFKENKWPCAKLNHLVSGGRLIQTDQKNVQRDTTSKLLQSKPVRNRDKRHH